MLIMLFFCYVKKPGVSEVFKICMYMYDLESEHISEAGGFLMECRADFLSLGAFLYLLLQFPSVSHQCLSSSGLFLTELWARRECLSDKYNVAFVFFF